MTTIITGVKTIIEIQQQLFIEEKIKGICWCGSKELSEPHGSSCQAIISMAERQFYLGEIQEHQRIALIAKLRRSHPNSCVAMGTCEGCNKCKGIR